MYGGVAVLNGGPYARGLQHGRLLKEIIEANLSRFWNGLEVNGHDREEVLRSAEGRQNFFSAGTLKEIAGIAAGAGRAFREMLAFNVYHSLVLPEECTVLMAVGNASASGDTIFAKNSDKVGGKSLVGDVYYLNKEINVVLVTENESGIRIIGVAAAGATGLKMGMNSKGVAAGTNIARTKEMAAKNLDLTQIRAIDRAQVIRDGLELDNALAAAQKAAASLLETPTATPGNVEFADAREAFIVESSYDRVAVKKVVDDIDSRSNCFIVMKELNLDDDLSSLCRYIRTQQLLRGKKGKLTVEDFIGFSMDHANGPGPNSICRHGVQFEEETSLSAAVMEINGKDPAKSKISICLGKPCHAWREDDGHITMSMDMDIKDIPQSVINGDIFKKYYTEEARIK